MLSAVSKLTDHEQEDMMRRNSCGHDDLYHEIQGQCCDRWGEYRLVYGGRTEIFVIIL